MIDHTNHLVVRLGLLLATLGGGCACDPGVSGGDAAPPFTISSPAMPSPPADVQTSCPAGWTASADRMSCEPWSGARPHCAAGERLAIGAGCVAIADDCAAVPPEVATGAAYVVPGRTGGDGSLAAPFGTIEEALASGNATIALGEGEHALAINASGVTIVGACPTTTTLRIDNTVYLTHGVTLRRMRVRGRHGIVSTDLLQLDRLEITELPDGVIVTGDLDASRVEMHDMPIGVVANRARNVSLTDVALERVVAPAIEARESGTRLSLHRVVVADVVQVPRDPAEGLDGAILVQDVTSLSIESFVIDTAGSNGMVARADATEMSHVALRGITGPAALIDSSALGATLTSAEIWVRDAGGGINLGQGVHAASVLVVQNVPDLGLNIIDATGTIDRVLVDGAASAGIEIANSQVVLRDVTVRNVVHTGPDDGGGLLVETLADVELVNGRFEATDHFGVGATDGGILRATNVEISNVRPIVGTDGYGAIVNLGASMTLRTAFIHDVLTAGVSAQGGTVTASDLTVRGVGTVDRENGAGVVAVSEEGWLPAAIVLTTADVRDVVRWGVLATGGGASIVATDLTVDDVHEAPCCEDARGGAAIVVHGGASMTVTTFVAGHSVLAGIVATEGVTASFQTGRIQDAPVGLILSGRLQFNTGVFPGLVLHDAVFERVGREQQTSDTVVPPPSLVLL